MLKETVLRILQDAAEIDAIQHAIIPTAVTREQLHWEADSDDRAVRNAIHDLRRDGYKIISSTDRAGYWLGGTDEWNAWCDKQRFGGVGADVPQDDGVPQADCDQRGGGVMILCFRGDPRTKKNHQQICHANGRMHVVQSEAYKQYERDCLWQIPNNFKIAIDYPVNVKCLFYMQTHRIVDLNGLIQSIDDILVKGGVLQDDNSRIVVAHDGSRVLYDKKNPRVEIYVEVMK